MNELTLLSRIRSALLLLADSCGQWGLPLLLREMPNMYSSNSSPRRARRAKEKASAGRVLAIGSEGYDVPSPASVVANTGAQISHCPVLGDVRDQSKSSPCPCRCLREGRLLLLVMIQLVPVYQSSVSLRSFTRVSSCTNHLALCRVSCGQVLRAEAHWQACASPSK